MLETALPSGVITGIRRVALAGAVGFRDVREAMREVARDPLLAERQAVMIDLRDVNYLPTTPEAEALADELSSQDGLGGCMVALVVGHGAQYGVARMICTITELRGGHVKAFKDDRVAAEWLMG